MIETMKRHLEDRGTERGFTLIEVLVVIALLAALVAIVAPQLFEQLDKGDATQVTSDLESVASSVKAFRVDVSPAFPGDIEDLVSPVSSSAGDASLAGSGYNPGQENRWNGPYLEVNLASGTTASNDVAFTTGFGGNVRNGLSTGTPPGGSGTWVTITVNDVSTAGCDVIETQVDDGSSTSGRYTCAGGDLTFFAVQQ